MKPILIVYATREGQTRRIAEHLADKIAASHAACEMINAAKFTPATRLDEYAVVIAAASLHGGRYEPEMVRFARQNAAQLSRMPGVFISVSLAAKIAADAAALESNRMEAQAAIDKTVRAFVRKTGWSPTRIAVLAGALAYSRYSFLMRIVMKRISAKQGLPVDTSHDYEFTDWKQVAEIADIALELSSAPASLTGLKAG